VRLVTAGMLGFLACVLAGSLFSQSTGLIAPTWSQDIVPDLGRVPIRGGSLLLDSNRDGIAFVSDERLLVYAVDHGAGELSSRRSPEVSSPFRLHVWLLDAESARMQAYREWGTRVHDSAVQVTSGGVLVKTGGIVRLYSSDLTEERNLPLALDANARVKTSVSVSGRTIMLDRLPAKSLNTLSDHFDVFDASTLTSRYSWSQSPPLFGAYSISDKGIVTSTSGGNKIVSTEFGSSKWTVLRDDSQSTCMMPRPTLVTDESLVWHCKDLIVSTTGGEQYTLPIVRDSPDSVQTAICEPYAGRVGDQTAVASGGRSVALSLVNIRVEKHLLTEARVCFTGMHVAVYDLTLRKCVLTVVVDPLPRNDYDFAISPDGSKLAILDDRKVSVFSAGTGGAGDGNLRPGAQP